MSRINELLIIWTESNGCAPKRPTESQKIGGSLNYQAARSPKNPPKKQNHINQTPRLRTAPRQFKVFCGDTEGIAVLYFQKSDRLPQAKI